jgi:hypothetical protein
LKTAFMACSAGAGQLRCQHQEGPHLRFLSLDLLLLRSRLLLCSLLDSRSLRLCFSFLLRSRLLSLLGSLLTDLSRSAGAPFGSSPSRPLIGLPPFSDIRTQRLDR